MLVVSGMSVGVVIAFKVLASSILVFAILRGVGKLGDRVSGMVAGLPYASAPALLWLALDRDTVWMAAVLTDSMVTASAYAAFAVFFLAFAHFLRGWSLLPLAAVASLALVHLTHSLFSFAEPTTGSLLVCGVLLWGARLLLPQTGAPVSAQLADATRSKFAALSMTHRHAINAVLAGLLVLFTMLLAHVSPRWMAAALLGLPLISATVLANAHSSGSHSKTLRTAEGFIDGCLIRACFCFFFALLLPLHGVISAFVCAIVLALGLAASLFFRARMRSQTHALESRQALSTLWIGRPR